MSTVGVVADGGDGGAATTNTHVRITQTRMQLTEKLASIMGNKGLLIE